MKQAHEFDLGWDGRRCIVEDLGAQQARQVARRIANVVGTAVREGGNATNLSRDVQAAGLVAMGSILEKLDDATIEWLTQTFAKVTRIEREPGSDDWLPQKDVNEHVFGGGDGLARWLRWMTFCLEITCADFFRAAFAEFSRLQRGPVKADPASPNGASASPMGSSKPGIFTAS